MNRTSRLIIALAAITIGCGSLASDADSSFNGLDLNLGNLYRVSKAKSRSISPENFTGEKGKAGMATEGTGKNAARDLGQGWKVSPSVVIKSKATFQLAEIDGPGAIQSIWMTPTGNWRWSILRFYWDDETEPSVECPVGDFFACGWGRYAQVNSLAVCVNPGSAFNCYWQMPFRKKVKVTMENIDDKDMVLYYQINYTLTEIPDDAAYFHAQFLAFTPATTIGVQRLTQERSHESSSWLNHPVLRRPEALPTLGIRAYPWLLQFAKISQLILQSGSHVRVFRGQVSLLSRVSPEIVKFQFRCSGRFLRKEIAVCH